MALPINVSDFINRRVIVSHRFSNRKAAKSEKVYYNRKMLGSIRANPIARPEDLKFSLISEFLYAVRSDLYERSFTQSVKETAASMHLIGGPMEWKRPLNSTPFSEEKRENTDF